MTNEEKITELERKVELLIKQIDTVNDKTNILNEMIDLVALKK